MRGEGWDEGDSGSLMSTIDKTFVKKSFNRHALTYDHNAGLQASLGNLLLEFLNGATHRESKILDIGMGTGSMTATLMKRFPDVRIHGCDSAVNMVACARSKDALTSRKELFITADSEFLPYRSGRFDLVISSLMYQWLERCDRAFGEVLRVLKPGGRFLCSAFGEKTFEELRTSYARACRESAYTHGEALQLHFTEDQFLAMLTSAGFIKPFMCTRLITEHYRTVGDLVRSIKGMGAQNASDRRNRGLGIRKVWRRMVELYEKDFGLPGRIPATFEVIMGGGRKP